LWLAGREPQMGTKRPREEASEQREERAVARAAPARALLLAGLAQGSRSAAAAAKGLPAAKSAGAAASGPATAAGGGGKALRAAPGAAAAPRKDGAADLSGLDTLFKSAGEQLKEAKAKRAAQLASAQDAVAAEKALRRLQRKELRQSEPKPVRFDSESGLNIYREADLRIGQGGGTADCPFDCKCCF
jgi:hypothetical protein